MIVYVVRRRHRYTIDLFLASFADRLPFPIEVLSWERAFRARRLPRATYLLTDLERLAPPEQERAAQVRAALLAGGARVLNDPLRSLGRYELLRRLHDTGRNEFDVVRLTEGRWPDRYPVFVRDEREHLGPLTELLDDREALEAAVDTLVAEGRTRDGRIAVGFGGAPDADGLYVKYGAFRVGDRIVPRHAFWSKHWMVRSVQVFDPERRAEELRYVRENPHADTLREIFEIAGIEYGRIDYGVVDGRIQTWEINTNAVLAGDPGTPRDRPETEACFVANLIEALGAIDDGGAGDPIRIPASEPLRRRVVEGLAEYASELVRLAGLSRWESQLRIAVYRRHWRRRYRAAERKRRGEADRPSLTGRDG